MKERIKSIIGGIPSGLLFDTHMIIEYLLQNDSDAYLKNCNGKTTISYHGYIGQIINDIAGEGLVKRIGDSWSLNIHKKFSKCACWEKL